MKTTRLQVTLRDVEPALARVIDVPVSATLPELHDLLQAAIGWTDSHLHQFSTPAATYGVQTFEDEVWPPDQRDENNARLSDLGARFEYLYDFGDGWAHDVEVLGPGGSAPGCVGWSVRCPRACGCCLTSPLTESNSLRVGGCHGPWFGACNNTARIGIRSLVPPPPKTT